VINLFLLLSLFPGKFENKCRWSRVHKWQVIARYSRSHTTWWGAGDAFIWAVLYGEMVADCWLQRQFWNLRYTACLFHFLGTRFMHQHATREDAAFCCASGKAYLTKLTSLTKWKKIFDKGSCHKTLQIKVFAQKIAGWLRLQRFGGSKQPSSSHRPTPDRLLIRIR